MQQRVFHVCMFVDFIVPRIIIMNVIHYPAKTPLLVSPWQGWENVVCWIGSIKGMKKEIFPPLTPIWPFKDNSLALRVLNVLGNYGCNNTADEKIEIYIVMCHGKEGKGGRLAIDLNLQVSTVCQTDLLTWSHGRYLGFCQIIAL